MDLTTLSRPRDTSPVELEPTTFKLSRGPYVTLHWELLGGRVECCKMEIENAYPTRPITTSMLRRFPWSSLIETNKRLLLRDLRRDLERGHPLGLDESLVEKAREAIPVLEASIGRRGRPPEYGPEHFAEVAQVYTNAWIGGLHPTKEVATHFRVARSTAGKWVSKAREAGLLPKTRQRVARARPITKRRKR